MNTSKAFWREIPRKSIIGFLLGVFFIFSAIGFANDTIQMGLQPTPRYVIGVLLSGVFSVAYAASGIILRKRFWKLFAPIFAIQFFGMVLLGNVFPNRRQPATLNTADISRLQTRLTADGVAITLAIGLGYACFVYVSITEARRYARVHAEIVLATEIHRVLVPTIDKKTDQFEFYGRALPAAEVGGDLIDVFQHARGWIAYIADVSGHGVAPGIVMAMVKSAARMQLSSGERSTRLLDHLNAVLYPIKKPEMYATFAYLAWDGELLEFCMAAHPPILHYHAETGQVSELACSNLPVGMFGGVQFDTARVHFAPDDLFLLFTDGVLEVVNKKGEEFGLLALQAVIAANARRPLAETLQAILDATDRHGPAADDRSMLLVRPLSSKPAELRQRAGDDRQVVTGVTG